MCVRIIHHTISGGQWQSIDFIHEFVNSKKKKKQHFNFNEWNMKMNEEWYKWTRRWKNGTQREMKERKLINICGYLRCDIIIIIVLSIVWFINLWEYHDRARSTSATSAVVQTLITAQWQWEWAGVNHCPFLHCQYFHAAQHIQCRA